MWTYFDHVAILGMGFLFVLIGRWVFLHPEKAITKFYRTPWLPNMWAQIWGTMAVALGFFAASASCFSSRLLNLHARQVTLVSLLFAGVFTFLLLRRAGFRRSPHDSIN